MTFTIASNAKSMILADLKIHRGILEKLVKPENNYGFPFTQHVCIYLYFCFAQHTFHPLSEARILLPPLCLSFGALPLPHSMEF